MREKKTIQERVIYALDEHEGTCVQHIANYLRLRPDQVSGALARLKRKRLAECASGFMGWSWFRAPTRRKAARRRRAR